MCKLIPFSPSTSDIPDSKILKIYLTPGELLCSWTNSPVINTGFFGCLKLSKTLLCIEILNSCFGNSFCEEKKIRVTKHLMNLMNETTPHYMSDTYHLTVVRYFCPCTQYERSIHFPIIVIIITPLDGAQCCSWPETFNVSSTEFFTFWKHDSPSEKDLGDEIKTQKGLSPLDRKEKKSWQNTCGKTYR